MAKEDMPNYNYESNKTYKTSLIDQTVIRGGILNPTVRITL